MSTFTKKQFSTMNGFAEKFIYGLTLMMVFYLPLQYGGIIANFLSFLNLNKHTISLILDMLTEITFITPLIIILMRVRMNELPLKITPFGFILVIGLIGSLISLLAHPFSKINLYNFISGFLTPLMIYHAYLDIEFNNEKIYKLFFTLSVSILIVVLVALYHFYSVYPLLMTAHQFIFAHYDQIKMREFMIDSYGNTSNTACMLILFLPALFGVMLFKKKKLMTWFYFFTFSLSTYLLFVIDTRVGRVALLLGIIALTLYKNYKTLLYVTLGLLLFSFALNTFAPVYVLEDLQRAKTIIFLDKQQDASLDERETSIAYGWHQFSQNLFTGVGKEKVIHSNPFTQAHQFNIEMAAEYGILGLLYSILLSLYIMARFFRLFLLKKLENFEPAICLLIGPFLYIVYGLVANLVLSMSLFDAPIALLTLYMTLEHNISSKYKPTPFNGNSLKEIIYNCFADFFLIKKSKMT